MLFIGWFTNLSIFTSFKRYFLSYLCITTDDSDVYAKDVLLTIIEKCKKVNQTAQLVTMAI